MTGKYKCRCKPPKKGCAHFGMGYCRLGSDFNMKCVMRVDAFHYLCCPFLNSAQGEELLKLYKDQRGIIDESSKT